MNACPTGHGTRMHRTPCPTCDTVRFVRSNPNRENGPWYRCWSCGALWDKDYNDLLVTKPNLTLSEAELEEVRAGLNRLMEFEE